MRRSLTVVVVLLLAVAAVCERKSARLSELVLLAGVVAGAVGVGSNVAAAGWHW